MLNGNSNLKRGNLCRIEVARICERTPSADESG